MTEQDTIAAISTPPGLGGLGMVRISGPDALAVGSAIFTPLISGRKTLSEPRKAVVGHVHNPSDLGTSSSIPHSEPIDQAIWLCFLSPSSYTGDDTVELTTHGGPIILKEVLEAALFAGARLAEPGEFTRRAFLNGRIDLSQAESVASLIFASTEEARRVMQRQVEGALGREASLIRKELLELKVIIESMIDFPEDVEDFDHVDLSKYVTRAVEKADMLLETSREGIAMNEGIKVVIAGAPNVGKSSLLNSLLQEERAIVHEIPGTTRDFIEGRINVKGIPMIVVDTAGIRDKADSLEDQGIARTRMLMKKADLLLVVMDGTRTAEPDEQELLEETARDMRVVAVNKSDLPRHPDFVMPEGALEISALTRQGIDDLRCAIHDAYTGPGQDLSGADAVVTSLRQAAALERVRFGCLRVREALESGIEPDLIAVDLEEALLGVGELTGEITADEVLGEIFSRFCIGK